jgi:hypothetical protein
MAVLVAPRSTKLDPILIGLHRRLHTLFVHCLSCLDCTALDRFALLVCTMLRCLSSFFIMRCSGSAPPLVQLLFCTTLHSIRPLLHRVGSWQCTTYAVPFCTVLHCLGSLCTAQDPWSALPFCTTIHCLCSLFAPHRVLAVHRPCTVFLYHDTMSLFSFCTAWGPRSARALPLHCLFVWPCIALHRFAPHMVLGVHRHAIHFCTTIHYLCSLFAPRGVLAVHCLCTAFLYHVTLPWFSFLHRAVSLQCTA